MNCFDFGLSCWVCGKGESCDYCKKVAGEDVEEQTEMILEFNDE